MTILELIWSYDYPKKTILEKLICHQLKITKEKLFTHGDQDISPEDLDRISQAYRAYTLEKQPLEYIKWYVEFAWLKFHVNRDTLIPRPETEYMIEAVREEIEGETRNKTSDTRNENIDRHCEKRRDDGTASSQSNVAISWETPHASKHYSLLDIWTWCGVLWLSTLYHCWAHISHAILTDLSEEALVVARKNLESRIQDPEEKANISFLTCNLLDHPEIKNILLSEQKTILVANLPYIPDGLFDENTDETVKKREPRMAFVWWDDGLDLYRIMFDQLLEIRESRYENWETVSQMIYDQSPMTNDNWLTMFLEMMTRQVEILRKEYPMMEFDEVKTFHFNIRIVRAVLS